VTEAYHLACGSNVPGDGIGPSRGVPWSARDVIRRAAPGSYRREQSAPEEECGSPEIVEGFSMPLLG